MSTSVTTHPPETNNDVVTSWLPLTTAYPVVSECVTAGIYSQISGDAVAWDPFFGINVEKSLSCLPLFATLWWSESNSVPLQTHTSLGPFVCPGAYTTGSTSVVNSLSTFVACCPSDYSFITTKDAGTLGQCSSPLTGGQVLTFETLSPSLQYTTTTIPIGAISPAVFAVHVNGYVFAPTSTTSSSSSSTSSSAAAGTTSSNTASVTSPTTTPTQSSSGSGGLATGAKVGIGIGVALGTIGIISLAIAFFIIKRRNNNKAPPSSHNSDIPLDNPNGEYYAPTKKDGLMGQRNYRHELGDSRRPPQGEVYEVSGEGLPREMS